MSLEARLAASVRTLPDYPKPGILFRDLTPLFAAPEAFAAAVEALAAPWVETKPDCIAGMEARGFIVGAALALHLGVGFIPLRKPGKLPCRTLRASYALEYGTDALEVHADAVASGQRVLLVDDLLATGGTAGAALDLIGQLGGQVVGASFVIQLPELGGAQRLRERGVQVHSLLSYPGH